MADELAEAVRGLTREIAFLRVTLARFGALQNPATFLQNPATPGNRTVLQENAQGVVLDLSSKPQSKAKAATKDRPRYVYPDEFEVWWRVYPRHENKLQAYKAYCKSVQIFPATSWLEAAKKYRDDPNRDASFTKLPATFLRAVDPTDEDALPPRDQTPADRYAAEQAAERKVRLIEVNRAIQAEREQRRESGDGP